MCGDLSESVGLKSFLRSLWWIVRNTSTVDGADLTGVVCVDE
jgi:hypothetical protein